MKRPNKLWIGFSSETKSGCYRVYEHDPHLTYAKRYHLHPGNEVARALNEANDYGFLPAAELALKNLSNILDTKGIPVRWDAKKSRFV